MGTLWTIASFPFEVLHGEIVNQMYGLECGSEDSLKMEASRKLEHMGFRVGYALAERVSKDYPRVNSELDIMKFVCKDFWAVIFKKQVDNLKTNHQGVYVVHDKTFCLLEKISDGDQFKSQALYFLVFPCGIIRGALQNLGLKCSVSAEISSVSPDIVPKLPCIKFNITVLKV